MASIKPETSKGHDLGTNDKKWGTVHTGDLQTETITTSSHVEIGGNLTVTGTKIVATVENVEAKDPLISLAKDNDSDSFDIGFYGKSVISGNSKYHGFVRDADDSGKFKAFKDASAEPGTTVGTHSVATVVADLEVPNGSSLNVPKADGTLADYITAVTLGTAKENKVLTVDGNLDLTGVRNLTASGTIQAGNVLISGSAISTSEGAAPSFEEVAITGGSIDGTTIGSTTPAAVTATTLNASNLTVSAATSLEGAVTLGDAAADDIVVTGSLASSIALKADGQYNLGTNATRMAHVYSDQLTATTINAFTAGGAVDFNNEAMTNVNITSGSISGSDVTVGSGKTLDVSAGTITFAEGQVLNADLSTLNTADLVSLDALDIDGATEMGEDLVDADLLIVDNGGNGVERSMLASRIPTYVISKLSGGTGVTHSAGTFSIGQAVATTDDVTFNTVTANTFSGVVTSISNHTTQNLTEHSSNKYYTDERVDDRVSALLNDGQAIGLSYSDNGAAAGELTISVDTATASTLGVASFSTDNFLVSSGAVTIKDGGIANIELAESSMNIAGQDVSLGGTITAASIAAAVQDKSMALSALTDLDGPQGDLTIFNTKNASQTLTIGHNTGTVAIPGDLDLTGNMKDDLNLVETKKYQINSTDVLSATTLGSGVVKSSLTSVGDLAAGNIVDGFGSISTANNISTTKVIDLASDADAADFTADSATGRLTLGASDDLNLYHHTDSYIVNNTGSLKVDVPTSADIQFSVAGTEEAHIDASGINLAANNDYQINNVSVLSANTLGSNVVTSSLTTVGALDSGSITDGFTSIDVGGGPISTSGTLTGGILAVDNLRLDNATIGHSSDLDIITLANQSASFANDVNVNVAKVGGLQLAGSAVTATATELNLLDGDESTAGTTAVADNHAVLMKQGTATNLTTVQTLAEYLDDKITSMPNLTTAVSLSSVGKITSGTWEAGAIDNGTDNITTGGILSLDIDVALPPEGSVSAVGQKGSLTIGAGSDAGLAVYDDDLYIENSTANSDINFRVFDGTTRAVVAHVDGQNGRFEFAQDALDINGTAVTTTAAELNILDANVTTAGTLTVADGHGIVMQQNNSTNLTSVETLATYMSGKITSVTSLTTAASLSEVGTIGTGVWQATDVAVAHGGTGASDAKTARENLGLEIDVDVQAHSSILDTFAQTASTIANEISVLTDGEIAVLDGVSKGTALSNKALVVDTSRDIGNINNLTASKLSDGTAELTSGNLQKLSSLKIGTSTSSPDGLISLGTDDDSQSTLNIQSGASRSITLNSGNGIIHVDTNDSLKIHSGKLITKAIVRNTDLIATSTTNQSTTIGSNTHYVLVDAGHTGYTVNLTAPGSAVLGREILIKNIGTEDVTVQIGTGLSGELDVALGADTLSAGEMLRLVAVPSVGFGKWCQI